jgi:hypothetical protein
MGNRQIVLVSTAGISVLNAGIFWREAKTKRLFSQWGEEGGCDFIQLMQSVAAPQLRILASSHVPSCYDFFPFFLK